jgi:LPS-assembly protein
MLGLISKMLFFNLPLKTLKTTVCLFIVFAIVLLFSHAGFAQEPVEITADHLEMTNEKDRVIGKGNVTVYHKGMNVKAEKIMVNSKTGKGVASGSVKIKDKTSNITGDKAFFNMNSKKGEIFNAKGHFDSEYLFTGERIKKEGEDHYKIYNGSLTTCVGDEPAWIFKCDYADLTLNEYAILKNPSFWIKNTPFFYLPYGVIPLKTKRASGFLFPNIGSSNRDGFFMNNSFFWAINEQMDATVYLDYLSKKGFRPGLEFRYTPTKNIKGQWYGTYLKEKNTDREFWKLNVDHKQEFDYGIMAKAKADMLSDNNYDKEYSDLTDDRTRRITDSHLNLSKNWENRSLEVLSRYRKSIEFDREEKYSLLPQVTFTNQRVKIRKTPLYFNMESSYTGIDNEIGSASNDVQRFNIHPQLSLPFTSLPWMTFTPTIGFSETYYSSGKDSNDNKTSAFSRELYDISMIFEGPKFFKIFNYNNSVVPKVKHLIEPRITYKYIPDLDSDDRDKITVFDGIDNIAPLSIVEFSLTNRFLKKLRLDKDSFITEEAILFEISQSYDFREATKTLSAGTERRPFSDVRWDIDSHIWTPLRLNFDGTFDVYDRLLKTANVELGIQPESFWSLYFERRYTRDQSTFILGSLGLDLKKGWRAKYSARYDELNNEFIENDFSLKYSAQCWDISFDFINRNNHINGDKQRENKFFFLFTLKGIGSIGKKISEELLHKNL